MTDEELDAIIAAFREARVGGTYWASRPELPAGRYSLVRVPADQRDEAVVAASHTALVWANSGDGTPIIGDCDPWHLLDGAAEVIVDAGDELALIAALAGVPLRCLGDGPYAALAGGGRKALRAAVRRHVVDAWRYVDPFSEADMSVCDAIAVCRI